MKHYTEIVNVDSKRINQIIGLGWELIETLKTNDPIAGENILYVVGNPYHNKVEEFKGVLKKYDEFGLKEELFKKIAEENGEDYDKIREGDSVLNQNKTTRYMNAYEDLLGSKKEYEVEKDDDIDTDYF